MISDLFGSFLTPLPPISDFSPILKAFLHRDSPIFENLPPLPKIGYHLWTVPKTPTTYATFPPCLHISGIDPSKDTLIFDVFLPL